MLNSVLEEGFREYFKNVESQEFTFAPPQGLREKIDVVSYSPGSDHDVLNSYGIPSVMILEWPDRFYHSNLDVPDNISGETLKVEGSIVAGVIGYLGSMDRLEAEKLKVKLYHYIKTYYHELMGKVIGGGHKETLSYSSRAKHLPKLLTNPYNELERLVGVECKGVIERLIRELQKECIERSKLEVMSGDEFLEETFKTVFKGPISMRALRKSLGEEYSKLRKLIEESKSGSTPLNLLCFIFSKPRRVVEALELLYVETSSLELEAAIEIVKLMAKAKVLSKQEGNAPLHGTGGY